MQLFMQLDSEDHLGYLFGDAGIAHLTYCPNHPKSWLSAGRAGDASSMSQGAATHAHTRHLRRRSRRCQAYIRHPLALTGFGPTLSDWQSDGCVDHVVRRSANGPYASGIAMEERQLARSPHAGEPRKDLTRAPRAPDPRT